MLLWKKLKSFWENYLIVSKVINVLECNGHGTEIICFKMFSRILQVFFEGVRRVGCSNGSIFLYPLFVSLKLPFVSDAGWRENLVNICITFRSII